MRYFTYIKIYMQLKTQLMTLISKYKLLSKISKTKSDQSKFNLCKEILSTL